MAREAFGDGGRPNRLVDALFEDKRVNERTPNVINFYLRTGRWDDEVQDWTSRLKETKGAALEIDAIDPVAQRVLFLPLSLQVSAETLARWVGPHRTAIIGVRLMRLPHEATFILRAV